MPLSKTSCTSVAVSSLLTVLCVPSSAPAQDASVSELISALQSGGHVLYIRHAMTETDYADQVAAKLGDCATQRVLSEAGWAQAKTIGTMVETNDIKVSDVVSSEYCRAWQTADLAFGTYQKSSALNFATSETYSDTQLASMKAGVVPFLSAAVAVGTRVVVGHDDPFEAATGIYPEPQGVAYVIRPEGNGQFSVLGHINPDAWSVD